MANNKQAKAVFVKQAEEHNAPIYLEKYNPDWPLWFEEDAEQLKSILGEQAVRVEHVGSTSVPGLKAKPRIDMVLVVEDSSDEATYVPVLEKKGYELIIREEDWFEHRMLRGPNHDINLHVFSRDCSEVEKMTTFRDWLRANEEDRKKYAETKERLAKQTWKYVQDYANAKGDVIQEIMNRALS